MKWWLLVLVPLAAIGLIMILWLGLVIFGPWVSMQFR